MSSEHMEDQKNLQDILQDLSKSDGGSRAVDGDGAYLETVLDNFIVRKSNREISRLQSLEFKSLASLAWERKQNAIFAHGRSDREIVGLFCQGIAEIVSEAWLRETSDLPRNQVKLRTRALQYLLLHFFPFERPLELAFETAPEFRELVQLGYTYRKNGSVEYPASSTDMSGDDILREAVATCRTNARRRASNLRWKTNLQRQLDLSDEGNKFGRNNRFWKSKQFWALIREILKLLEPVLRIFED